MFISKCCLIYSHQVGCILMTTFYLTVGYIILDYMISDLISGFQYSDAMLVVTVYLVLLIIICIAAVLGAYYESRFIILIAFVFTCGMIIYWLVFVFLSFTLDPQHLGAVCIATRCAVSLWIIPVRHRNFPPVNCTSKDKLQYPEIPSFETEPDLEITIGTPVITVLPTFHQTIVSYNNSQTTIPTALATTEQRPQTTIATTNKVVITTEQTIHQNPTEYSDDTRINEENNEYSEDQLFEDNFEDGKVSENKMNQELQVKTAVVLAIILFCLFVYFALILLNYYMEIKQDELEEEEDIELDSPSKKTD